MAFMVPYRSMLVTYVVCGFYGLLTGPIMALGPPAMVRLVKKENLSTAMGIAETTYGVVLLAGKIINYKNLKSEIPRCQFQISIVFYCRATSHKFTDCPF